MKRIFSVLLTIITCSLTLHGMEEALSPKEPDIQVLVEICMRENDQQHTVLANCSHTFKGGENSSGNDEIEDNQPDEFYEASLALARIDRNRKTATIHYTATRTNSKYLPFYKELDDLKFDVPSFVYFDDGIFIKAIAATIQKK
jgi:hypothetical protein